MNVLSDFSNRVNEETYDKIIDVNYLKGMIENKEKQLNKIQKELIKLKKEKNQRIPGKITEPHQAAQKVTVPKASAKKKTVTPKTKNNPKKKQTRLSSKSKK
jgi:hypothetical protein